MHSFKIMIIEDDLSARDAIQRALERAMGSNRSAKFVFAVTTSDAFRKLHSLALHGISIDQNMPENPGGLISRSEGQKFLQKLRDLDPPAFMSIYTGYPALDMANLAGLTGGIPYIVKSIENSSNPDGTVSKTSREYCIWFVNQMQSAYIERVLRLVQQSGFHMLHQSALHAHEAYSNFFETNFTNDEYAHLFMEALGMFRESFALTFAAFIAGIGSAFQAGLGVPRDTTKAGVVEEWIERSLNKLQSYASSKDEFCEVSKYFHLEGNERIADLFVGGSSLIRNMRNDIQHNSRRYRCDDFVAGLPQIFTFMDIVGWLVRRPMVNQPRRTIAREYLTYSELNRFRAKNLDIYYDGEMPEVQADRVFSRLSPSGRLLPLDGSFVAEADHGSIRRRLSQVFDKRSPR